MMERIEIPQGRNYQDVKKEAGMMMISDLSISSVRVLVQKETHKMWIEITRFPQKTADKLKEI